MKSPILFFTIILLFILLSSTNLIEGQQIIFNKVFPPDGKTFGHVTCITQDINGYMWFTTKKGLYSYDGYTMTAYRNNSLNPNSIMSNSLESVYADSNLIWIGSLGAGLSRLDPASGLFTFFKHDPKDTLSLANDTVTAILRDSEGILWIGTHGGLDRFDSTENKFYHYRFDVNEPSSISNNQVRSIYEDKQGTIWIGTGSPFPDNGGGPDAGGLNRLNKETGMFTRYLHDPKDEHSLISNKVRALFEDNQGVLWIGTSKNGLHKMNRQLGSFERLIFDPVHPEKLSGPADSDETSSYDHITFFTQDAAGAYWFGTVSQGLYYFDPKIGRMVCYNGTENSSSGFESRDAWFAYTSRDGILWISSMMGDLYWIDPLRKEIPHFVISQGFVNSFFEEPNGALWIGTNQGVIIKNIEQEQANHYLKGLNTYLHKNDIVSIIKEDQRGNILVAGTWGLTLLNKNKEPIKNYRNDPKDKNSISSNFIYTVYEEKDGNLWIGTNRGFNLLNSETGSVTQYFFYPEDTNSFSRNFITSFCRDKTGKLWIGGWFGSGIHLFDNKEQKLTDYLKGAFVSCIYEDLDGVLWVGCSDGLYKYDPSANNFIRIADSESFEEITDVVSMIEDDKQFLWLGTSSGIIRINPQRNETSFFGKNYGVGENQLAYNSCYKGRKSDLYFGDATGYYQFKPADLTNNGKPPEIIFAEFRLADQIIKPGIHSPLIKSINQQKEINLGYNQNVFSFDFAAINYSNPNDNKHFFMLENYESNWHRANTERRAYYFNIPPGKYVFRVKAANSYGIWAEKRIDITIMPPWWRTWWAYCIYGLLFIALIYAIDRFQRRRLLQIERERSREKELAQAKEIEKAYTELKATQYQLIQSEKMASLGELTAGIAHEIQNPLNFVNNFSEVNIELLAEMKEEMNKGNLEEANVIANDVISNQEKINHHGKRADAIVKGMLQHSRTSTGQKEPTDINALADEYLRLAYHGLRAKDKSFNATMKTDFDGSIGKINVIPQDIGRVMLNLITNAFYACTERSRMLNAEKNNPASPSFHEQNYEPTVTVSTKRLNNKVQIVVKDNGNGIPQKVLEKIFQPFFTTKPTGQGTGLGLSISYDIITKGHGGELKVNTVEGKFAEFSIVLNV